MPHQRTSRTTTPRVRVVPRSPRNRTFKVRNARRTIMTAVPVARVATRPHHTRLSPAQRAELLRLLIAARTALRERARMLATVDGSFDASTATWGHGETEHTAIDVERRVNGVLGANTR